MGQVNGIEMGLLHELLGFFPLEKAREYSLIIVEVLTSAHKNSATNPATATCALCCANGCNNGSVKTQPLEPSVCKLGLGILSVGKRDE